MENSIWVQQNPDDEQDTAPATFGMMKTPIISEESRESLLKFNPRPNRPSMGSMPFPETIIPNKHYADQPARLLSIGNSTYVILPNLGQITSTMPSGVGNATLDMTTGTFDARADIKQQIRTTVSSWSFGSGMAMISAGLAESPQKQAFSPGA